MSTPSTPAPRFSHFKCTKDSTLRDFLLVSAGLSQLRINLLLDFGAIYHNGKRLRQDVELRTGDTLRVHFRPKRYVVPDQIEVIYEDEDFLAVDKPSGLPTHPTLDNYVDNAAYFMQTLRKQKCYVTGRLDIGTAGVLILAKTGEAQVAFNRLLQKRQVHKIYRALTSTQVPLGRFEHHIEDSKTTPKKIYADAKAGFQNAILNVRKTWKTEEGFASELKLETGRTHQIRAQLSFLGHPILGDALYGCVSPTKKYVPERLALECFHISFTHRARTIGIYRPTSLATPRSTKDS